MNIRSCTISHAALLAVLHGSGFAKSWDAPAIAGLLATPGTICLLADEGDSPLGFVMIRAAADECEILTIVVAPEHGRRGIGGALLEAATDLAAKAGLARMFLEVAEDNQAARNLYAGHGFREVGRRKGYYPRPDAAAADALVMERSLL